MTEDERMELAQLAEQIGFHATLAAEMRARRRVILARVKKRKGGKE
jgi:hypothetical protein